MVNVGNRGRLSSLPFLPRLHAAPFLYLGHTGQALSHCRTQLPPATLQALSYRRCVIQYLGTGTGALPCIGSTCFCENPWWQQGGDYLDYLFHLGPPCSRSTSQSAMIRSRLCCRRPRPPSVLKRCEPSSPPANVTSRANSTSSSAPFVATLLLNEPTQCLSNSWSDQEAARRCLPHQLRHLPRIAPCSWTTTSSSPTA